LLVLLTLLLPSSPWYGFSLRPDEEIGGSGASGKSFDVLLVCLELLETLEELSFTSDGAFP
jgi:hypothetical protein